MSKAPPAFQFYAADFLTATTEWEPREVGVYIRMLSYQWITGSLPADMQRLARVVGCTLAEIETMWPALSEKFQEEGGRLLNARLEEVRQAQKGFLQKQGHNGSKGGNPNFQKGKPNPYYPGKDNPEDNQDNPGHNPKITPSSSSSSETIPSSLRSEGMENTYVEFASEPDDGDGDAEESRSSGAVRAVSEAEEAGGKSRSAIVDVRAVFDHWRQVMGHERARLDKKREGRVRDRLRDGYTVEDLCLAVDGCRISPHHMGENDQATVYDDLELICRDATHVDKFIRLAKTGSPGTAKLSAKGRRTASAAQRWLEKKICEENDG